ncbi:Putative prophage major tail sheath protein [Acaryochloris thomasi RCC1774]|uniref:Prophage major tail sheath protein n=1 Tax=Acaryochloris thomasi RCC1774 TaxID=1764569 RepID=A0A2W1JNM1_9CYAN|nr:phage tail sheath C-terminal domain-containing protein [Acaryochloris thomasi]PZD70851.1 Putative prophage major tail sheath protein [Acaryochloris thomasi RCC1774]
MARLDYSAPGVYVEEVDRGARPIDGVSTSIAGFIGFTEDIRDDAELFKPMLVTTWTQYLRYFAKPNSDGYTDFDAYLPFAVRGYFLNGGGRCWVTSIGTQLPGMKQVEVEEETPALEIPRRGNRPSLKLNLLPQQAEEGNVKIEIIDGFPRALPPGMDGDEEDAEGTGTLGGNTWSETPPDTGEFFDIRISRDGEVLEQYEHLSMDPEPQAATYVVEALRGSQYVAIGDIAQPGQPLARRPLNGEYEVKAPLEQTSPEQFTKKVEGVRDDRTGVRGIFEIDEITMLCFPDLMRAYETGLIDLEQVHGVMETMVSLSEGSSDGDIPGASNRMVVLDPPPDQTRPQDVVKWLDAFGRRSMFSAMYYPWIKVPNPRKAGRPILIPPSGHMMGVWGRTDETRGVHKAPANEVPRGVTGLAYDVNFREQELLNPLGINCIRKFPNRGIRIWGARTLVEPDITEWRYISVRRLISYIERSIEIGTQWAVFEPNDPKLWSKVRYVVSSFLERIWREGALVGRVPQQAFFVKCDEEINTPETMALGRLYVEVGVSPVRPAEFVVFRISQMNFQLDQGDD